MKPIVDLIDREKTVLLSFRGHDLEKDVHRTPLFIEISKSGAIDSICVSAMELAEALNAVDQEIILHDMDFSINHAKDERHPPRHIRIRRRARIIFEDGGSVDHLELSIYQDDRIMQALISYAQWLSEMTAFDQYASSRLPATLAA